MSVKEWSTINPHWLIDWYIPYLMSPITYKTRSRWERQELERKTKKCQAHSNWITNQARVFKPKKKNEWHTSTTTTTPSKIPLTRGLRRSECRQPYPCKYHYSQRGRMPHIKWTKFIEWNPLAQKAHVPSFKSLLGGGGEAEGRLSFPIFLPIGCVFSTLILEGEYWILANLCEYWEFFEQLFAPEVSPNLFRYVCVSLLELFLRFIHVFYAIFLHRFLDGGGYVLIVIVCRLCLFLCS